MSDAGYVSVPIVKEKKRVFEQPSEFERALRRFRRSGRAKMLRWMDDLIEVARKNAVSRYTRRIDRSKWVRLSGQLIWYRDSILKNYEGDLFHAEVLELQELILKRDEAEAARNKSQNPPGLDQDEQKKRFEAILRQQGNLPATSEVETNPFNGKDKEDESE